MVTLASLREVLDAAVDALPAAEIPDAIGALAATYAKLLRRLAAPAPITTPIKMLTAEQIAESFAVPVSQVYALARQRRIPSVMLGKYRRFDLADVRRVLAVNGAGSETSSLRPQNRASNIAKQRRKKPSFPAATALLPAGTAPEAAIDQARRHAD